MEKIYTEVKNTQVHGIHLQEDITHSNTTDHCIVYNKSGITHRKFLQLLKPPPSNFVRIFVINLTSRYMRYDIQNWTYFNTN